MFRMKRYMVALASLLVLLVVGHFYVNKAITISTSTFSQSQSKNELEKTFWQDTTLSSNISIKNAVTGEAKFLHRQLDAKIVNANSKDATENENQQPPSQPTKKPPALIASGHFPVGFDVRPFAVDPVKYAIRMAKIRLLMELYGPHKTREIRQKSSGELMIPEIDVPRREILIISYWRSGSSFLGDLINNYPATFYHFEPLHAVTYNNAISTRKQEQTALNIIQSLMKCNYSELDPYLDWVKQADHQFLFSHNKRLWVSCRVRTKLCFDAKFLTEICKAHPVQLLKLVRLRLNLAETLLQNNSNLKMIYLVRDPRGMFSSRMGLDWCNESSDCIQTSAACESMRQDLEMVKVLSAKFPKNFVAIRYEDLALDPKNNTEKLFKFLELPLHRRVASFIKTNTQARDEQSNPYSTRRNSKTTAFKWRQKLTFEQVQDIQNACTDVIQNLGFSVVNSEAEMKNDVSWVT